MPSSERPERITPAMLVGRKVQAGVRISALAKQLAQAKAKELGLGEGEYITYLILNDNQDALIERFAEENREISNGA